MLYVVMRAFRLYSGAYLTSPPSSLAHLHSLALSVVTVSRVPSLSPALVLLIRSVCNCTKASGDLCVNVHKDDVKDVCLNCLWLVKCPY